MAKRVIKFALFLGFSSFRNVESMSINSSSHVKQEVKISQFSINIHEIGQSNSQNDQHLNSPNLQETSIDRRKMIVQTAFLSSSSFFTILSSSNQPAKAANIPEQKSYSSNARNLDRLNSGDASGGSVYNNSPVSPVAAKRRAMVGCKVSSSRIEASKLLSQADDDDGDNNNSDRNKRERFDAISEKDCNMKVMGGDTEFMLKALRNLDCPTCPYGIEGA